jgi:DNA-binding NarL/FixJ family response regulator
MEAHSKKPAETRVVIIDDHPVLSELITSVVDSLPNFRVVGRTQTEQEALALCTREQPDVVVLDLVLSASSGLTLLVKLGSVCPRARVVIFSGNLTPGIITQALAAGAFSLISKSVTLDEFRTALLAVAAGRTYFSPEISAAIKTLVTASPLLAAPGRPKLSRREAIVLAHLAQGFSSKEIAAKLGVSAYTVANHRSRLMKKTGLHRAAQLSLYAERHGLLNAPGEAFPPR